MKKGERKMKKLFALFSLLIIALCNNISPIQSEDLPFTENACYTGKYHTETDYQAMYTTYIGETSATVDSCNTSPIAPKNPKYRKSDKGTIWFILEGKEDIAELLSDEESATSLNAKDGNTILAPFKVRIVSSANASNRGHTMIVESLGGQFKITFYDMSRWYCCINREPKTEYDHDFTHTKDAKGQVLSSGDIIGLATASTTVLIEEKIDGVYKKISTRDLYTYQ